MHVEDWRKQCVSLPFNRNNYSYSYKSYGRVHFIRQQLRQVLWLIQEERKLWECGFTAPCYPQLFHICGHQRSPKRNRTVCMALKFDRKLNNNIPSKPYKNYNKVWESSPFWAVYLSPAGPRAVLFYVNEKVGKLEVEFDPSFEENTSETSLCQEAWCAVLPEQHILGEVHLLRHRPSLKTKLNSNRAPFLSRANRDAGMSQQTHCQT